MPPPKNNKRKNKNKARRVTTGSMENDSLDNLVRAFTDTFTDTSPRRCLTLEEDEMTRCDQLATEGDPDPNRCKVHHRQYRILCKKYKDAQQVVDDMKQESDLPTKEQIGCYQDWEAALEKARWVRKYLEAIRVEKRGREIHQKRFFLQMDGSHRDRYKLLEGEMIKAIDTLDALQKRASDLYKSALPAMKDLGLSATEEEWEKRTRRPTEELVECTRNPDIFVQASLMIPPLIIPISEVGTEDLIDMSLRDQRERMVSASKPLISLETYVKAGEEEGNPAPPDAESGKTLLELEFFSYQQFARRIIFYEPCLFMKSLGKTSFEDFILSDDLSMEDLARFLDMFFQPMGFPLKWFKDALLDALAMSRYGTADNPGGVENRIPFLGGWIFDRANEATIPNELWGFLLKVLEPPGDVENRFVRLCNNFDDLVGFLSFEALGFVPSPSFCRSPPHFDADDPGLSRNHLSLSGIIVADMVAIPVPPPLRRPVPTTHRARQRGCVVWAELEPRTYMFGALRNDRDAFAEAFIRELRARPDLFQVVLRSETAPGRRVEMFGSGTANNQALPAVRGRQFEAPPWPSPPSVPPSANDRWEVEWSALDVLYGSKGPLNGYLTNTTQNTRGSFFRFKTFPVTYFVILDTVPYRDQSVLARNVAWAALRAGGYAEGEYTIRKYAVAADKLLEKCAKERLEWLPEGIEWKIPRMQDQMGWCNIM